MFLKFVLLPEGLESLDSRWDECDFRGSGLLRSFISVLFCFLLGFISFHLSFYFYGPDSFVLSPCRTILLFGFWVYYIIAQSIISKKKKLLIEVAI